MSVIIGDQPEKFDSSCPAFTVT